MRLKIRYPRNVQIVIPNRVSIKAAFRFAEAERAWVAQQISRLPEKQQLTVGGSIPYLGVPYEIVQGSGLRGGVVVEQGRIVINADVPHIPRRVQEWLRKQAKAQLSEKCEYWAKRMGVRYQRITVRDQKTRWGSCSSAGSLNFSWRLVMMPEEVLEYIVIHELSHLIHLDHSPAFWRLVSTHCPSFETQKKWLKINGTHMHKYDTTN